MKLTITLSIHSILLVSCLLCIFSCSRSSSRLGHALALAGENRRELEKVMARYSANPSDSLKYRAAVFLIENMPGQGYYKGEQLSHFLEYYPVLRKVRSRKGSTIEEAVDSIRMKYGIFDFNTLEYCEDIKTLDSAYLCDNIDWAFKVWKEQPWGKSIDFNAFCEYILPYRVGNEVPVRWREMYYNRYNGLLDAFRSSENPERDNPAAAAQAITDSLTGPKNIIFTSATPAPGLPSIGPEAAAWRCGSCQDLVDFDLYLCRALGIPAAADYMPFRGDGNVGHTWAAFPGKDGSLYCQDMGNRTVDVEKMRRLRKLKVYRKTASLNDSLLALDIPKKERADFLKSPRFEDVTWQYAEDFHKKLSIGKADLYSGKKPRTAYLCMSSRFSWVPVAAGRFRYGGAEFTDIDAETQVMRVAGMENGRFRFWSDPFYITVTGEQYFYHPSDSLQDITVFRKFSHLQELWLMRRMRGGVFEGSNDPDFTRCDTLHIITELPGRLQVKVRPRNAGPYRYVRYYGPRNGFCNIAELAVLAPDGQQLSGKAIGTSGSYQGDSAHDYTSALDGNPATSFDYRHGYGGWVGLDLEKPEDIGWLVYTPRNRDNHVRPGDEYELYYCDTVWKSAGTVIATADSILYKGLPSNTVYILDNHTRGNQIRVFSYDDGEQVWLRPGTDFLKTSR